LRVLVTGAGGQVGRAVLASAPSHVSVTPCTHAELDISTERAAIDRVLQCRPEVIINAAAYTAVDRAESEPDAARRVNTEGPRNLARAARESGARLIHLSTDFVFDGASAVPYPPEAPTRPLSVYGATKLAGEAAVLEGLPERSIVLRTAWVYSAGGRNFMLTMLGLMRSEGSVRVVSDQVGTPTSARSVAEAIWRVVDLPDVRGVHHWSDAGVASWYDFAVAIGEEATEMGLLAREPAVLAIATEDYPTPARRPPCSVLDKRSLMAFGLQPIHWRKRLRSVLQEIRDG